jgi:hypothetical protein
MMYWTDVVCLSGTAAGEENHRSRRGRPSVSAEGRRGSGPRLIQSRLNQWFNQWAEGCGQTLPLSPFHTCVADLAAGAAHSKYRPYKGEN